MEDLDLLYKALHDCRKDTQDNASLARFRRAVTQAGSPADCVESVRSVCVIESDWIDAIEKGLPFIEEAIREERQFIRQEGNVVPIEQVRHVSKASVGHLARHGNLISHAPADGEDLTPDRLYVEEKLSDYAVYENRFLYMLLCYLRDFVSLRYEKITAIATTWKGRMRLCRDAGIGKRRLHYELSFEESVPGDELTALDEDTKNQIRRIAGLQSGIAALLGTPLMQEVAKSPMIKPPITRTNALRMDNVLRMALWLYDFIAAYEGAGYRVEERKQTLHPLPSDADDEAAELVALTSLMTYEYGNGLRDVLEAHRRENERLREESEAAAHEARIRRIRAALDAGEIAPESYIAELEDRGPYMDVLTTRLAEARAEIAARQALVNEAERRAAHAAAEAESFKLVADERLADMEALQEQAYAEVVMFESRRVKEKLDIEAAVNEQRRLRADEQAAMTADFRTRMEDGQRAAEDERARITDEYEKKVAERDAELETLRQKLAAAEEDRQRIRTDLLALRAKYGLTTDMDDYSSKERFEELTEELRSLDALIGREWKHARRRLRNEYLWNELTRKEPESEGEHGADS